jgi:hypothetical protein
MWLWCARSCRLAHAALGSQARTERFTEHTHAFLRPKVILGRAMGQPAPDVRQRQAQELRKRFMDRQLLRVPVELANAPFRLRQKQVSEHRAPRPLGGAARSLYSMGLVEAI